MPKPHHAPAVPPTVSASANAATGSATCWRATPSTWARYRPGGAS